MSGCIAVRQAVPCQVGHRSRLEKPPKGRFWQVGLPHRAGRRYDVGTSSAHPTDTLPASTCSIWALCDGALEGISSIRQLWLELCNAFLDQTVEINRPKEI
jgi:hypothetical protein